MKHTKKIGLAVLLGVVIVLLANAQVEDRFFISFMGGFCVILYAMTTN